jgi:osmotically inducible lipoprotein OsmB
MTNIRKLALGTALVAAVAASGCGHSPTNQEIGTAGGAVLGGVAGSAATGGSTLGTVGGAAVGGVLGNEYGKRRDERR